MANFILNQTNKDLSHYELIYFCEKELLDITKFQNDFRKSNKTHQK